MHIDEYVSPTSWDDLEMDWTNPDCRDARYVNALILAIHERYSAICLQADGYDTSLSYPYLPTVTPDRKLDYTKLVLIHNAILNLLMPGVPGKYFHPFYVNPDNYFKRRIIQKSGSDYSYGTWNPWNLADIIESIGDTQILYPQPYCQNNNAWLLQQYKIINKLNVIPIFWSSIGTRYTRFVVTTVQEGVVSDVTTSATISDVADMSKNAFIYSHPTTIGQQSRYSIVKLYPHVRPFPMEIIGYIGLYSGGSNISEAFPEISIDGFYFTELSASIAANEQGEIDFYIGDSSLMSYTGETKSMSMAVSLGLLELDVPVSSNIIAKINFNFQD